MEKAFVTKGMSSFECLSPSELDRKFFGEQSLLSAMSLEQTSLSRVSNEGSGSKLSLLASLCISSDPASPSQVFPLNSSGAQEADGGHLQVPLQGKSSTPYLPSLKQKEAPGFDLSYGDLAASHMTWDVSLIKSESSSPKACMESGALEAAASP